MYSDPIHYPGQVAHRPHCQGHPAGSLIIDVIEIAYYDRYECRVANAYARRFGPRLPGWRSAVIYTFVEQIRRHGADPFAWFEWVFEKLMHNPPDEQLKELLPSNWLKTRPAASQTIESRVA